MIGNRNRFAWIYGLFPVNFGFPQPFFDDLFPGFRFSVTRFVGIPKPIFKPNLR